MIVVSNYRNKWIVRFQIRIACINRNRVSGTDQKGQ